MKITIKKKYILPGIIGAVVVGFLVVNGGFFGKGAFESWTTSEECFEFEHMMKRTSYPVIARYKFEDKKCGTKVDIPNKIGGVEVTEIWDDAFRGVSLTSVKIPDSVKRIGNNAFKNNKLTSLTIPESVYKETGLVFKDGMIYEEKEDNILTLEYNANINNTNITIPSTVNGKKVTEIGDFAFEKNNLTSLVIPKSVYESTKLIFKDGIVYRENEDNTLTLEYNANINNTKITIPSIVNGKKVTEIGFRAFEKSKLTSITIPDSVTEIGNYAFNDDVEIIRK